MKVMNIVTPHTQSLAMLGESLLEYLPEGFTETQVIEEADIFICFVHHQQTHIWLQQINGYVSIEDLWKNPEMLSSLAKQLNEKTRIFYMDQFGEGQPENLNKYPVFIRENDIPIAPNRIPDHTNFYIAKLVDPRKFYVNNRRERVPKSCILINDHLNEEVTIPIIISFLKNDVISKLTITNVFFENIHDDLKPFKDKLNCLVTTWPDGVRTLLNESEFVLNMRTDVGTEYMGIEGGFCGCQPIYPDTAYYRSHFGDDLGVAYYNLKNKDGLKGLKDIIQTPSNWEQHREAFVNNFSASVHVPLFWEHVREIVNGK